MYLYIYSLYTCKNMISIMFSASWLICAGILISSFPFSLPWHPWLGCGSADVDPSWTRGIAASHRGSLVESLRMMPTPTPRMPSSLQSTKEPALRRKLQSWPEVDGFLLFAIDYRAVIGEHSWHRLFADSGILGTTVPTMTTRTAVGVVSMAMATAVTAALDMATAATAAMAMATAVTAALAMATAATTAMAMATAVTAALAMATAATAAMAMATAVTAATTFRALATAVAGQLDKFRTSSGNDTFFFERRSFAQ